MEDESLFESIKNERVSKAFTVDNETLSKIKQFMKKYGRGNFSKSIEDLVILGLANLGFADREKAIEKFKYKGDYPSIEFPDIPELKDIKTDFDYLDALITPHLHDRTKIILDIIQRLCDESKDGNAYRVDIIVEAETKGLQLGTVNDVLKRLKLNGTIYELVPDRYNITEY